MSFKPSTTLIRRTRLRELRAREHGWFDLELVKRLPPDQRSTAIDLLPRSKSQLRQDIFALAMNGFKTGGFFVEFGATDGVELNNSWMMEHDFGWTGILAEPSRGWHADLKANRKGPIVTRCVWKETGAEVEFTQAPRGVNSGISTFVPLSRRMRGTSYTVETVSLNDLLEEYDAPARIDYISIDTEGSELDILGAVDFDRWSFGAMTVEHGHAPQRDAIHDLLVSKGYRRVFAEISDFDDWYVPAGA